MTTATPKFCAECGGPLAAGAKFCAGCGTKVDATAKAEATPDVAVPAAETVAPAAEAAPVAEAAPAPVEAPKPEPVKAEPAPAAKKPALSSVLHSDDDDDDDVPAAKPAAKAAPVAAKAKDDDDDEDADDDDDAVGLPKSSGGAGAKRPLPVGLIALGGLVAVLAGIGAYIGMNEERSAAFQCNILGHKDKCETDADRRAKIEEQESKQEQDLLINRAGTFQLGYSPEEETLFLLTQKRYEEDRKSYVGRVTGSVSPDDEGKCPNGYTLQTSGATKDKEGEKKCVPANGIGDNRKLIAARVADVTLGTPDAAGLSKATFQFVVEDEWKKRHPSVEIEVPLPAPPGGWPVSTDGKEVSHTEMKKVDRTVSWWPVKGKKVQLPLSLDNLPLMEKEQCAPISADKGAKCERLTPERIKEIEQKKVKAIEAAEKAREKGETLPDDPTTKVRTSEISTYTYEVELWALGYKARKVLFYEEPAPPDVDTKKLEAEGWTVRKFKRTPDGKFLIDNASFDLVPEPATLQVKYLSLLKALKCLKESPDYKGKSDTLKTDAEERLKEEMFFNRDKWEIAILNEKDPAWVEFKDKELKAYACKAPEKK